MPELPELKPELLLKITKEIKAGMLRRSLKGSLARNLLHNEVLVTADEISAVADALKFNVFYVATYVYNEATRLAAAEAKMETAG
jgi:hypothetical protein